MGFFFGYLVGSWMKESAMKRQQEEEELLKRQEKYEKERREIDERIAIAKKKRYICSSYL